jgi:Holliday junction resolvase-like predicted endonuclease
MRMAKSTRHSKITGNFAESLVLYWMSKYGFECALIDHTGIDIIARNPHTREVMGISVKSRSRREGTEDTYVSIPNDNFAKAEAACRSFDCIPYFAIVVDAGETIRAFILSADHLRECFPQRKRVAGWKMSTHYLEQYAADPHIRAFEFKTRTTRWWEPGEEAGLP